MKWIWACLAAAVWLSMGLGTVLAGQVGVIVVDVQGDFTTYKKGSLAVPNSGEDYIRQVEQATRALHQAGFPIYATQDWHPKNHMSFYTNHPGSKPFQAIKLEDGRTQVMWPPHCVQGTPGAEILLDKGLFRCVVQKGKDPKYDSYSGFRDDGGTDTEMNEVLKKDGIKTVVVYGIATDYCVKATAIDAKKAGYKVVVINELCRGVAPETSKAALKEMQSLGIQIMDKFDLEQIKKL